MKGVGLPLRSLHGFITYESLTSKTAMENPGMEPRMSSSTSLGLGSLICKLRYMILFVNLGRPQFPDIWASVSLDVAIKVFFR